MTYVQKPRPALAWEKTNSLGLTRRDYEGSLSTLCAGCGHDSITAAIVKAFFELEVPPHQVVKISGIGCSSKTPAYFLRTAHGFNSVHGRMPSIATGANAANSDLVCVGVSGDGDSLSIGLGQFAHAVRRNMNMLYIIENNGVYGLTKGQFSASADVGSKAKKGEVNQQSPIDPMLLTLSLGASFVARSFSGDKAQLVPLIKAGIRHKGFALIDVMSPCVTFNDHEDSTKSYSYMRRYHHPAVQADFIAPAATIQASGGEHGEAIPVQLHDGSRIMLRKAAPDYDPTDRAAAFEYIERHQRRGEVVTGLLYINEQRSSMHDLAGTVNSPLTEMAYEKLSPGSKTLADIQKAYR
ncbi:MAG: 2-oxoacid:ferredoxin oxidoreductase subunit beta [Pseudomonadota bacterium]